MKRRARGIVKSSKMDKTISVVVERLLLHPRYGKYVRRTSTYKAHDTNNEAKPGDLVEIEESRPLSKTKTWRLVRIVRRAQEMEALPVEEIGAEQGPVEA